MQSVAVALRVDSSLGSVERKASSLSRIQQLVLPLVGSRLCSDFVYKIYVQADRAWKVLSRVEVLQFRHERQTAARRLPLHIFALSNVYTTSTAFNDMFPKQRQNLAAPPSGRYGPIGRLECAHSLRPLALSGRPCSFTIRLLRNTVRCFALSFRRSMRGTSTFSIGHGSGSRFLRSPVIDIPIIFVKEKIILLQLLRSHGAQIRVGEGGEEQIGL